MRADAADRQGVEFATDGRHAKDVSFAVMLAKDARGDDRPVRGVGIGEALEIPLTDHRAEGVAACCEVAFHIVHDCLFHKTGMRGRY